MHQRIESLLHSAMVVSSHHRHHNVQLHHHDDLHHLWPPASHHAHESFVHHAVVLVENVSYYASINAYTGHPTFYTHQHLTACICSLHCCCSHHLPQCCS